ncbi:MAG: Arc family DNA binding domain-containing protein [Candidatus Wallbacteria bacterium]|nr:Arc family DNA binding domain-containing protein [Candidatus Wallbacteria bacterium]
MADKKSFLLRLDPKIMAELEACAASEFRSINGQIEYLLKQAIDRHKSKPEKPCLDRKG